MNFKPSGAWVVLPDPTSDTTDSGIILDDTTRRANETNILKVLAAGPHCQFLEVGDTAVIDPRTEAIRMDLEGKACLLVGEHQVIGKL